MKIKTYKNLFIDALLPIYDEGEAESFFYIILEDLKKMKRIDLALSPDLIFSEGEVQQWRRILDDLKKEIPIQYVMGKTHFYDLEFTVNENVLIPRPETEELVAWIINDQLQNRKGTHLKILDIGTGSGCIAITLAKNIKNAIVFALDVSKEALATAQKNAFVNEVEVTFLHQDILETGDLQQQFDVIVSNPPYVRNLEKHEIKKNVLDNEPHLALFVVDNDALLFYRKIAILAQKNLAPNGQLYFEINQYLGTATVDLLEKNNFKNIELRKDIYGNDRMIKATIC